MKPILFVLGLIVLTGCSTHRPAEQKKTVVFVAGKKSHGPGEHEYEAGLRLLQAEVERMGLATRFFTNGWPDDAEGFRDAATAVFFCDGSDRDLAAHPLLREDRLSVLGSAAKQKMGMVALHYTVFVPNGRPGEKFLKWMGGYFDYQSGTNQPNHWWSKIETRQFHVMPLADHPITRGLAPFDLKEEYYFHMRFPESRRGWTPIVGFGHRDEEVVGWALERPDGGRGFGYTGGHFHKNWEDPNVRRLIVNGILWTAQAEAGGRNHRRDAKPKTSLALQNSAER